VPTHLPMARVGAGAIYRRARGVRGKILVFLPPGASGAEYRPTWTTRWLGD